MHFADCDLCAEKNKREQNIFNQSQNNENLICFCVSDEPRRSIYHEAVNVQIFFLHWFDLMYKVKPICLMDRRNFGQHWTFEVAVCGVDI